MSEAKRILVTGKDNWRGFIDKPFQANDSQVLIQLEDGRRVAVPANALVRQDENSYYLPLGMAELRQTQTDRDGLMVVPVIAEELNVQKREVQTGGVRVRKLIHEREEMVDEPLLREKVNVERVAINKMVDTPPQVRYEGEIMIIPVLEEVFVVQKQLMVKEEIRITKQQTTEHQPQSVTLRSEEVVVEDLTKPQSSL